MQTVLVNSELKGMILYMSYGSFWSLPGLWVNMSLCLQSKEGSECSLVCFQFAFLYIYTCMYLVEAKIENLFICTDKHITYRIELFALAAGKIGKHQPLFLTVPWK